MIKVAKLFKAAKVLKSRHHKSKAKGIRNNMTLIKSNQGKIDHPGRGLHHKYYKHMKTCGEGIWKENLKQRIIAKIEKGNKTKDVSKNGPFTTAKELEHTLHWRPQLQEFIIMTKMAYYVKMHKWGKLSRPDLFWLNGISHAEKLENLLFLSENDHQHHCLI